MSNNSAARMPWPLQESEKAHQLHQCAIAILYDHCPFDPDYYLCTRCEEYDPEICQRCWSYYLLDIINGTECHKARTWATDN